MILALLTQKFDPLRQCNSRESSKPALSPTIGQLFVVEEKPLTIKVSEVSQKQMGEPAACNTMEGCPLTHNDPFCAIYSRK
jgi:hypothetical protein